MATLVKVRPPTPEQISGQEEEDSFLASQIPRPFPVAMKEAIEKGAPFSGPQQSEARRENRDVDGQESHPHASSSRLRPSSLLSVDNGIGTLETTQVMPSIASVQQSCLVTLNDFLSASSILWQPIVPSRRRSDPYPQSSRDANNESAYAMRILLDNLRSLQSEGEMVESPSSEDEGTMLRELSRRLDGLELTLSASDVQLARAIVSLLSHIHRLSVVNPAAISTPRGASSDWDRQHEDIFHSKLSEEQNPMDTLRRQLSDLQVQRQDADDQVSEGGSPVLAVQTALLWSNIDSGLETVLTLCRAGTEAVEPAESHLPPKYKARYSLEDDLDDTVSVLPEYDPTTRPSFELTTGKSIRERESGTSSGGLSEKMRADFDAITMAIDRLYLVAPQLHNQRVELKQTKIDQMTRAAQRFNPSMESSQSGMEEERDARELDKIIELVGKASERKLVDQSVILDGGMQARMEKAKQRSQERKEKFVEHLLQHSDAGRLHDQDAVHHPRTADPEALLSLPEFMRERVPKDFQAEDPDALLTLPEFVKEIPPPPESVVPTPTSARFAKMSKRSRSLSAPPLAWLMPSRPSTPPDGKSRRLSRPTTAQGSRSAGLSVHYVAEHHENLHHVLVFLKVDGLQAGTDLEAEVYPHTAGTDTASDRLMLRCGSRTSPPLSLPVRVIPGKKEVKVQSGHFEVKLPTLAWSTSCTPPVPTELPALLDASQLSAQSPTSFICASCSLPLVQSSKVSAYRDLPSEYWEELLEAWMCHPDEKVTEKMEQSSGGFWPTPGQALVGGSYILFDASSMVETNFQRQGPLNRVNADWQTVRCICGAVSGRRQEHVTNGVSTNVYRLAKYALRPVSPTSEPIRVPLSAFIVQDMTELVAAHATYRFVLLDEEEDRPRLLIWLFKPSIRIAYTTPKQYVLPKGGSIHAAKVLYKIVGPADSGTPLPRILDRYPGFPQAEHLLYPIGVCRRLAALLTESTTAYPEGMRAMTGLDVGWLTSV